MTDNTPTTATNVATSSGLKFMTYTVETRDIELLKVQSLNYTCIKSTATITSQETASVDNPGREGGASNSG